MAIALPPAKNVFVMVVIVIAPLIAALLVWTRYSSLGQWTFLLSMLGALLFGVYHHYVMVSPDNTGNLPSGSPSAHSAFITSAAALALIELVGTLYDAFSLRSASKSLHQPQQV